MAVRLWASQGAGGRPRSIWPPTCVAARWLGRQVPGNVTNPECSSRSWTISRSDTAAVGDHDPGHEFCWRTRRISNPVIRRWARRHHVGAIIPEQRDALRRRKAKGRYGGRPLAFDAFGYRQRNVVERCANKLKAFRAVATRYDKRDYVYLATIDAATVII